MLEPPALTDERIIAALSAGYGLTATHVCFLPLGNDSGAWSYRVEAADGAYALGQI